MDRLVRSNRSHVRRSKSKSLYRTSYPLTMHSRIRHRTLEATHIATAAVHVTSFENVLLRSHKISRFLCRASLGELQAAKKKQNQSTSEYCEHNTRAQVKAKCDRDLVLTRDSDMPSKIWLILPHFSEYNA